MGSEFSLTSWTCSCKPFLDLSFGVAPVCCHSEKPKRVLGHLGSWDSLIRNTCTEPGKIRPLTNPNGGFVVSWTELAWGLGCQFPNIFGLSVPVSRSVMVFFQLWWVLKLQSQNFIPGKLTAPYVDRTFGFPISEMRTFRYALRKNMVSLDFSLSKI